MQRKLFLISVVTFLILIPFSSVQAAILFGDTFIAPGDAAKELSRGQAVDEVVSTFDLEHKQKSFLLDCIRHADDCFFVFSAMSDYNGISFSPLVLYPDVFPAYKYYKAINTASILGLVHGFLCEDSSPFHPEDNMTRIQALKVILGAADLMTWKEKFEIDQEMAAAGGPEITLPYKDVDPASPDIWWYRRYLNFALDAGIIDPGDYFRPDASVTEADLTDMMSRAMNYSTVRANDNKTVTSANQVKQTSN